MNRFSRFSLLFFVYLSFFSLSFAADPLVFLDETSYPPGPVTLTGTVSQGSTVSLYVNDELVRSGIIVPVPDTYVNLSDEIKEIEVPIGSEIYFRNINQFRNFSLEFETGKAIFLEPEEISKVGDFEEGEFLYEDLDTGQQEFIISEWKSGEFVIGEIDPRYFVNGQNTLRFEFKPQGSSTFEEEFTITYNKYPNTIKATPEKNITKRSQVHITGTVSLTSYDLGYVVNTDTIANLGVLNKISLNGSSFETNVKGLREGKNTIRIISYNSSNPTYFLGEKKIEVEVDTQLPFIDIYNSSVIFDSDGAFTNIQSLVMNIETDAKVIEYSFNGRDENEPLLTKKSGTFNPYIEEDSFELRSGELKFTLIPASDFNSSFVRYSYNDQEQRVSPEDGVIEFEIRLRESAKELELRVFSGAGDGEFKDVVYIIEDYAFGGFNEDIEILTVINNSVVLEERLVKGQNNLTLKAIDAAGNLAKEAHTIFFSDEEPEIIDESLTPKEMFENRVSHFFAPSITGKTNVPKVEVTVFTIGEDAQDFDGNRISCSDYTFFGGVRNLGQLDRPDIDGPELNINESQISLLGFIDNKQTFTTNGDGSFGSDDPFDSDHVRIILQERPFDYRDFDDAQDGDNRRTESVESDNTICFVLKDRFGNVNIEDYRVTYDAGNTAWKVGEITTTPNSLYAAEIEQTGDEREGRGNVGFGMIVRFQYVGGGQVTHINSFNVDRDRKASEETKFARTINSEMNYRLDPKTGELIVYIPVEILPFGEKPLEYPETVTFSFEARPVYDVDDIGIPIDTRNPIYFQTQINIEGPLDHTKFLTPEKIDQALEFLNETIEFTQKAADLARDLTTLGVITCGGTKIWHGFQLAKLSAQYKGNVKDPGYLKDKAVIDEKLYYVCDRVVCSESPQKCSSTDGEGFFNPGEDRSFDSSQLANDPYAQFTSQDSENNEVLGRINNLNIGDTCTTVNGQPGVIVRAGVTTYSSTGQLFEYEQQSERRIEGRCVEASYEGEYPGDGVKPENLQGVNLQGMSGVCYNEESPRFDNTRCLSKAGWNPKDNIIESVGCGCFTDSYSHLNNLLKIQEAIQGCLEQAKIGNTKGSYCERLLSQAVCDVVTNILFKTAAQNSQSSSGEDSHDTNSGSFLSGLAAAREGDKQLNERYGDSAFFTQLGFSTEQMANKVCFLAVTGDWGAFTDNILNAVDQNEIEPTFGPAFPESRLQGYNPFTGELSVRYLFTYAAISGGQHIRTKVEFICDSSKPGGEHCPTGGRYNSRDLRSSFTMSQLYIEEGGSRQDSIVVTDTSARFRYNVLRLIHEYRLNGETKIVPQEEEINSKGEFMLKNCYFTPGVLGSGSGYNCQTLFDDDSLASAYSINERNTQLLPLQGERAVYYPENYVLADLHYLVNNNKFDNNQNKMKLYSKIKCAGEPRLNVAEVNLDSQGFGHDLVPLFKVPEFGVTDTQTGIFYRTERIIPSSVVVKGIKVRARQGTEGPVPPSFNVLRLYVDSTIKNSDSVIFDINPETGFLNNYEDIIKIIGKTTDISSIKLDLDRNVENIDIILVPEIGGELVFSPLVPQGIEESNQVEILQEGTCNVEMRLTPFNVDLTLDEFASYSSVGHSNFTNVDLDNEIYKETFVVKRNTPKGKEALFNFGIASPYNEESFCVKDSGTLTIPIELAAVSSDREFPYKDRGFDVTLQFERYSDKPKANGDFSFTNNIYNGDFSFTLNNPQRFEKDAKVQLIIKAQETNLQVAQKKISIRFC